VYTVGALHVVLITPCRLPHVAHSSHRVHCLTWHIHHTVYTASHGTFITPCTLPHVAHSSYRVHCFAWHAHVCASFNALLLLQEKKPAKGDCPAYEIIHLVDLTGFEWKDSDTNCPPRCLTCPVYLKGYTPCIGILTVLSNLPPIQVLNEERPTTASLWLGSSPTLCKPEVFHNRWRTDKDPTQHLTKYSLIPARVST